MRTSISNGTAATPVQVPAVTPSAPPHPSAAALPRTNPNELGIGDLDIVLSVLANELGLNIRDLGDVIQKLEDAHFRKADWDKLGISLGLHKNTLDVISANERGDVDRCFTECLVKWLSRADDVDSKCNGKPSYSSLADALDRMGNNKNQADYIRGLSEGKKPAKRQKLDPGSTKKCGSDYKYNGNITC
uniref:Death domain-containing protein n=1 Tax=Amphimedon queenslandica TaxID=400682 RepID=A0A1X7T3S4_AMPQE